MAGVGLRNRPDAYLKKWTWDAALGSERKPAARTMPEATRYLLATVGVAVLLWLLVSAAMRAVGWARKGSPAAAFIGWALLLLGAGMNPQPPPQEQVEEANRPKRIKKNSESGDPKD